MPRDHPKPPLSSTTDGQITPPVDIDTAPSWEMLGGVAGQARGTAVVIR